MHLLPHILSIQLTSFSSVRYNLLVSRWSILSQCSIQEVYTLALTDYNILIWQIYFIMTETIIIGNEYFTISFSAFFYSLYILVINVLLIKRFCCYSASNHQWNIDSTSFTATTLSPYLFSPTFHWSCVHTIHPPIILSIHENIFWFQTETL